MLDRDLAVLYGVETRALNQAVKRNSDRFPPDLAFQVDFGEVAEAIGRSASAAEGSRSQFVTLNKGRGGNIKYRPYAFTEHGILMLASVLRSPEATQVGLGIVRAFVAMRKALASVAPILTRLEAAERRQITDQARNEERFDTIFRAMDGGEFPPQKVFFEGKHYDAWSFARKLVRRATESIVLVDGYCDTTTLDILAQNAAGRMSRSRHRRNRRPGSCAPWPSRSSTSRTRRCPFEQQGCFTTASSSSMGRNSTISVHR